MVDLSFIYKVLTEISNCINFSFSLKTVNVYMYLLKLFKLKLRRDVLNLGSPQIINVISLSLDININTLLPSK